MERSDSRDHYFMTDFGFVIRKDAAFTALVATGADANLYAAAPDLLAACEMLLKGCDSDDPLGGDTKHFDRAVDLAEAALAKARGQ